jgi:hypothetical protein
MTNERLLANVELAAELTEKHWLAAEEPQNLVAGSASEQLEELVEFVALGVW